MRARPYCLHPLIDTLRATSSPPDLSSLDFIFDRLPTVPLLDAAPEVLLLDEAPFDVSHIYSYVPPSTSFVNVPELDWAIPERPTIRAHKDTVEPTEEFLDIYLYHWSLNPVEDKPFTPVEPSDDLPPMWTWEEPEGKFERIVGKKGRFPAEYGRVVGWILLIVRGVAFLWLTAAALCYVVFVPEAIVDLWRTLREERRHRRRRAGR